MCGKFLGANVLNWTKYPAIRNFHRISTERFFLKFLMVFDVSLEMQSDSKNYVNVQDDEIIEFVHSIKSQWSLTDCCRSRSQID